MNGQDQETHLDLLKDLMNVCLRTTYKARESELKIEGFQFNCLKLFGKDYKFSTVSNTNGELCSHYPTKIVVLEYSKCNTDPSTDVQSMYDVSKLKELFYKARFARCRSRFTVPVILYNGKHICRGATLSGGAEMYGRSSFEFFTAGTAASDQQQPPFNSNSEWQLFDRIRGQDIRLLKELDVRCICDLMVEKKKVKFGLNVTSSEKVDKENRYADFLICSVPYPGCEFFREWRENNFKSDGVKFDWSQAYVDAELELPGRFVIPHSIDWSSYRSWDLTTLTKNYLKLFLNYIEHGDSGILIHCISGWDRTPLFISLVRLSLWADMSIHQSLGPADILYLTIAYDWFLFGHNFPDRLAKGEDIFFFCFNFLKEISSDDFVFKKSVKKRKKGQRTVSRTDSEFGIEGVLLDTCRTGSNTSINSSSSLNSTKSSIDNAPIYFNVHDDDTTSANGCPQSSTRPINNSNASHPPSNQTVGHHPYNQTVLPSNSVSSASNGVLLHGNGMSSAGNGVSLHGNGVTSPNNGVSLHGNGVAYSVEQNSIRSRLMYTSTSPKAVPQAPARMLSDVRQSSVSGSWQMISGSGSSIRESTSSYESPQCSSSSQSEHSTTAQQQQTACDCSDSPAEGDDSPRKQRLEAVRQIFLSIYTSLDLKSPGSEQAGGISGIVGNFAEKLGIKSARSTVV